MDETEIPTKIFNQQLIDRKLLLRQSTLLPSQFQQQPPLSQTQQKQPQNIPPLTLILPQPLTMMVEAVGQIVPLECTSY